ncbi:MAG: hypothetical protein K9G33_07445 [Sneathiella sp.]|nr:hypothetical protein [Sneathiella sp.]
MAVMVAGGVAALTRAHPVAAGLAAGLGGSSRPIYRHRREPIEIIESNALLFRIS